jgi:hypothetical protein
MRDKDRQGSYVCKKAHLQQRHISILIDFRLVGVHGIVAA